MVWLIALLIVIGVAAAAAAGFFAGRLYAPPTEPAADVPPAPLTEQEKKERRELQNFLRYDGFSQS